MCIHVHVCTYVHTLGYINLGASMCLYVGVHIGA